MLKPVPISLLAISLSTNLSTAHLLQLAGLGTLYLMFITSTKSVLASVELFRTISVGPDPGFSDWPKPRSIGESRFDRWCGCCFPGKCRWCPTVSAEGDDTPPSRTWCSSNGTATVIAESWTELKFDISELKLSVVAQISPNLNFPWWCFGLTPTK